MEVFLIVVEPFNWDDSYDEKDKIVIGAYKSYLKAKHHKKDIERDFLSSEVVCVEIQE